MNANNDDKNNQAPAFKSGGRQCGFSLIEIMVALTLSLFLITGMIQLLIGNKQSYRVHEAQSRIQENGRFALEVLNRDIRMAGFTGCPVSNRVANVLNDSTTWWEDFENGSLVGYDGTQAFPGQDFGTGDADRVRGTDAIAIVKGGGSSYSIVTHNVNAANFDLNRKPDLADIKTGSIVMVCDTKQTSILQLTMVNANTVNVVHNTGNSVDPGNCTKGLGSPVLCTSNGTPYKFGSDSTLVTFVPTAFYIGLSSSDNTIRSLYQMQPNVTDKGVASMVARELVQGVQDMQIVYGEDTSGDGVVDPPYEDATKVTNWNNVLSVRVNLLMTSLDDNLATARQTVTFPADTENANTGGNVYTPASTTDRRLRQVFSSTIGVRNRLP